MSLLNSPILQFVSADGVPLRFAKAYLYLSGTNTPVDTFADVDQTEPHTFPVVADSQGIFPPIFYEGNVLVRMKLVTAEGDLVSPLLDVDPVNQLFMVYAPNIADGAIEEKLGYTPVDPANAIFTDNARMDFVPAELNVDDIGFRGNPVTIKNLNHTFALEDSQRLVMKDDSEEVDWTIPKDTFPIGHYFELWNGNSEVINLMRATDVVLRAAGDSTDANRILQPYYRGRVQQVASNEWVLSPDTEGDASGVVLAENGYYIMPNGYIRQWGKYTGAIFGDASQAVIFPIAFPTACYGANVSGIKGPGGSNDDASVMVDSISTSTVIAYCVGEASDQVAGFYWEAWGS